MNGEVDLCFLRSLLFKKCSREGGCNALLAIDLESRATDSRSIFRGKPWGHSESAGINRLAVGNERVLQ